MASDTTPKGKLAMQKAEEAMQSHIGKELVKEKYQSLKLEAQVHKQKEEIEELKNTPKGTQVKILKENALLKEEIKTLKVKLSNSEHISKTRLEESNNLERHVKRLMLEKAELNDKIEQLTDEARKFEELYVRAKGVAQALGRAVSILTTENKHG